MMTTSPVNVSRSPALRASASIRLLRSEASACSTLAETRSALAAVSAADDAVAATSCRLASRACIRSDIRVDLISEDLRGLFGSRRTPGEFVNPASIFLTRCIGRCDGCHDVLVLLGVGVLGLRPLTTLGIQQRAQVVRITRNVGPRFREFESGSVRGLLDPHCPDVSLTCQLVRHEDRHRQRQHEDRNRRIDEQSDQRARSHQRQVDGPDRSRVPPGQAH